MENTEQSGNKVQVGVKVDPAVYAILDQIRAQEDRTMSNMVERLLKTHPRIQEVLEGDTASATA